MPWRAPCTLRWLAALMASAGFASEAARAEPAAPTSAPRDEVSDLESPALRRPLLPLALELEPTLWKGLASGNLLRAQLDSRSTLALRLRGGRIGLYLQVQLSPGARND